MLHFKSRHDLSQLPSSDPAFSVIKSIVDQLISAYSDENGVYNYKGYGFRGVFLYVFFGLGMAVEGLCVHHRQSLDSNTDS